MAMCCEYASWLVKSPSVATGCLLPGRLSNLYKLHNIQYEYFDRCPDVPRRWSVLNATCQRRSKPVV